MMRIFALFSQKKDETDTPYLDNANQPGSLNS